MKTLKLFLIAAALTTLFVPRPFAWGEDDDALELEDIIKPSPQSPGSATNNAASGDDESLKDLEKIIEVQETNENRQAPVRSAKQEKSRPVQDDFADDGGERAPAEDVPDFDSELAGGDDAAPTRVAQPSQQQGDPYVRNVLNNLEFRQDGPKSRIIVTSRVPLRYREVKNPTMKQIIYFFENTETPERLQRAYDTTEFVSPVALFTLLQMPKESPPSSKLIIQLREDAVPSVITSERGMYIEFGPPKSTGPDGGAGIRIMSSNKERAGSGEENLYLSNQSFTGRVINKLEIKNSDIQDVLRLIAKTSGYNIVVGDDVTGKVGTMSLNNVPWDQAFALVLQSKKLGYVKNGNVIRVATLTSLKTEKDEALASEQARIKVEPLRTVLIPISYAKAAELAPQGKSFLSERGAIDTDPRTNTIIVKDVDRVVTRVQKLFAALDTQPPRVAISAKIIEMKSEFSRSFGFNALSASTNFSGINLAANQNLASSGSNVFTLRAPQFASLETQFQVAESESKAKTLANPSVSVVANRQASISQSLSFFVQDSSVAGGVVIPTSRQVTTTLTMDATPIVAGDGSIFLTLNLKNEIPNLAGSSTTIDARNVSTQVLLENGDTAVVGGVFTNNLNTGHDGIPLLMRIPVLGNLFSRHSVIDRRNEIFVFVTAKITNAEESFKRNF